jgi:hypothetical protein
MLERNGYECYFTLGLLTSERDLEAIGIPPLEAVEVLRAIDRGPRRIVAEWTPHLRSLPVTTPTDIWLSYLPVDLGQYAVALSRDAFDSLYALKHITMADCEHCGMPPGHARVLIHCVRSIAAYLAQPLPSPSLDLDEFLALLSPPLDDSAGVIRLAGVNRPLDLAGWSEVRMEEEHMLLLRGQRRVLLHYIHLMRTEMYSVRGDL